MPKYITEDVKISSDEDCDEENSDEESYFEQAI